MIALVRLVRRPPLALAAMERIAPASIVIAMRRFTSGSIRSLVSATFVALLTQISIIDAAQNNVCEVSAHPSSFDHQRVTLEGIAAGLTKGTSRSGSKYITFVLRSTAGCGSVIVFVQAPTTLSNGDRLQVEGIFEVQHLRDGSTFYDEMQATKIIALPR